ncbi:MAG TPA: carboxypeptidase-like regulatory domain-containing protein [Gemmatimonadaceae bacterium]|nr:carboxypeptidase-like regulatory domain-containing protein [Gemmatimonadaceae bacterium]
MTATADADGRFRLEGIPTGEHFLRVEHPVLDTLGVALRSPRERYSPGAAVVAELATPSPETLISIACSAAWRARGPAAFMGRVREADTGVPATGAKVSLVWYELDVSSGIKRVPKVREVVVGADGTYRICGLPAQLDGKVQVINGPLSSGEIAISFGDDLVYLRNMSIAAPRTVAAAAPGDTTKAVDQVTILGTARLTGRVLSASGTPIVGARVQLEGTTRTAQTRSRGEFVLDSLPPGTQSVSVRHLGYAPVEEAVDLTSATPSSITIRMSDFVPVLATVRVTAARERALDAVGYAHRKRTGLGHYLEGDQINQSSQYFSDVLRNVPGLRIQSAGHGRQMVTSTRSPNGCVMFWIDGTPWQQMEPGDIDDFLKPHELAAVEVYNPSSTPVEFSASRGASCTTIVGWTHRRLDRGRK